MKMLHTTSNLLHYERIIYLRLHNICGMEKYAFMENKFNITLVNCCLNTKVLWFLNKCTEKSPLKYAHTVLALAASILKICTYHYTFYLYFFSLLLFLFK